MDNVNQPQGQGPQDNSPTQPSRFTPGWPGGAQGGQGYGAPPGGPQWQHSGPGPQPPRPKNDWKHSKRLRWTAGIAAAVLLGAGGAFGGEALASSGGSSSNASQAVALNTALSGTTSCATPVSGTPSRTGKKGCLRLRLRHVRGMYGQISYHASNGTETLAFERGTVVSSSGGTLVVKAGNGTEWTWSVASSSIVRESGKSVSSSLLTSGANVFVGGQVVGSSKDARLIVIHQKKTSGSSSGSSSSGSSSSSTSSSSNSSPGSAT